MSESQPARPYTVNGRRWIGEGADHALEQHTDAFPDEEIEGTKPRR